MTLRKRNEAGEAEARPLQAGELDRRPPPWHPSAVLLLRGAAARFMGPYLCLCAEQVSRLVARCMVLGSVGPGTHH